MSNTFTLNAEQKKLCHELTMEFIHQNNCFINNHPKSDKPIGYRVHNLYFDMYEEIAIGINENWKRIDGELSK